MIHNNLIIDQPKIYHMPGKFAVLLDLRRACSNPEAILDMINI